MTLRGEAVMGEPESGNLLFLSLDGKFGKLFGVTMCHNGQIECRSQRKNLQLETLGSQLSMMDCHCASIVLSLFTICDRCQDLTVDSGV